MSKFLRNNLSFLVLLIVKTYKNKRYVAAFLLLFIVFPTHSASDSNSFKSSIIEQINEFKQVSDAADLFENYSHSIKVDDVSQPSEQNENSISTINQYIIGGNSASRNEHPEYTLVIFTDSRGEITGFCGGSLIAENKVLTAGHCSQEPASRSFAIPGFYSFNDRLLERDIFTVSQIVDHPQYNVNSRDNDVGIFTLSRNASGPVLSVFKSGSALAGRNATVIGTGLTSTNPPGFSDLLQEVINPIIGNSQCNDNWQQLTGFRPITSTMMCAGFANNGRGSCSGDSGGPLIVNISNKRVIVGTVSFGLETCEFNRGTNAYARMTAVSDFIRSESPATEFVSLTSIAPIVMLLLDDDSDIAPPL